MAGRSTNSEYSRRVFTLQTIDSFLRRNILRLFPGLLILDGVNLFRIVFPIQRQPQITRDRATKDALAKAPFTYPVDVQGGFVENELVQGFVMQFCAK